MGLGWKFLKQRRLNEAGYKGDTATSNKVIAVKWIKLFVRGKEDKKKQRTAKEAGWGVAG